jgi:hypothetical protein
MAVVLHHPGGEETPEDQRAERCEQRVEADAAAIDFALLDRGHGYKP